MFFPRLAFWVARVCAVLALVATAVAAIPALVDAQPTFDRSQLRACNGKQVTVYLGSPGSVPTEEPDVILGTEGSDVIDGLGGDDIICGRGGDDVIHGGSGRDWISGDGGNDRLYGDLDIDRLFGRSGDDYLDGGGGSDRMYGHAGVDTLAGGSGADRMFGGPGNDVMRGMGGQDFMYGEDGDDVMQGNWQSDRMYGGPGDDELYGAGGKDRLYGEDGNDTLAGGLNTDYLDGGPGVDTANGGRGRDKPLVVDESGCVADTFINCQSPAVSSTFTYVLRAKPSLSEAAIYDAPNGTIIPTFYQYLDGGEILYPHLNPTFFGNPLVFSVVEGTLGDEWARVQLPIRPAGSTGWVRTDGFDWESSDFLIEIDVGTNQLVVIEGDQVRLQSPVVSGRPEAPTPVVSSFIDELVPGANQAYGPWIMSIGAFSESLNDFSGALPKLAVHGTSQPELMGQYRSSGGIRVPNDVIEQIVALVPVGSRVEIIDSTR